MNYAVWNISPFEVFCSTKSSRHNQECCIVGPSQKLGRYKMGFFKRSYWHFAPAMPACRKNCPSLLMSHIPPQTASPTNNGPRRIIVCFSAGCWKELSLLKGPCASIRCIIWLFSPYGTERQQRHRFCPSLPRDLPYITHSNIGSLKREDLCRM